MSQLLKAYAKQRNHKTGNFCLEVLSEKEAKELLYDFNHTIMINDVRGGDEAPPVGEYLISRQTFNQLQEIAAGNPMADQRKDINWMLNVNRGGVVKRLCSLKGSSLFSFRPESPSITCRYPNYNDPERWYVLRFVAGVLG